MTGHTKSINAMRFSPDGRLLASACKSVLTLNDTPSLIPRWSMTASDNKVCIWSPHTGKLLQTIANTVNGPVTDIVWITDKRAGQGIVFGCADGTVHTYVRVENTVCAFYATSQIISEFVVVEL